MISQSILIVILCAPVALAQNSEPQTEGGYTPATSVRAGGRHAADTGTLHASFHAGQIFSLGNNFGANSSGLRSTQSIALNLDYDAGTPRSDLQFRYDGGALLTNTKTHGVSSFQRLNISDNYQLQRVNFVLGDTFDYSPETSSFGGSIPGVGSLGSQLGLGTFNPTLLGQGNLLVGGTTSLSNATFGEADFSVNARSTLTSSVSYGFKRFPDFRAFNSHQLVITEGFDYRITARTSAALSYDHSRFHRDHVAQTFAVDQVNISVSHAFSPTITVQGSFGPQWIHLTGSTGRRSVAANVSAHYKRNQNYITLQYVRSTTSGSIALFGSQEDLLNLNLTRQLTRNWTFGGNSSYIRGHALLGLEKFHAIDLGAQINRSFNQRASAYLTYVYRRQNTNFTARVSPVIEGDVHTIGVGLTFTPRGIRLRR